MDRIFCQLISKLKSTLLSKPVLITASFYLPFIGQTDAGNKAIRAVLSQDISDVVYISSIDMIPRPVIELTECWGYLIPI
jgi:hypothetical protein